MRIVIIAPIAVTQEDCFELEPLKLLLIHTLSQKTWNFVPLAFVGCPAPW